MLYVWTIVLLIKSEMVWLTRPCEFQSLAWKRMQLNESFPMMDIFHELYILKQLICVTWNMILHEVQKFLNGIDIIFFKNMGYTTKASIYISKNSSQGNWYDSYYGNTYEIDPKNWIKTYFILKFIMIFVCTLSIWQIHIVC